MVEKITDKDILDQFYTSEIMIILCIALLELPLTLVKKIEKLKFFAFFGVAGILVFVVCLVVHFFVQMAEWEWQLPVSINAMPTDWFRVSAVIPNLLLALSYQMNYFPIYKGMVNSNDAKMNKASLAGIGACSLAYLIVGILGYSLYGSSPDFDANFLLALPIDKINTVLFFGMNLGFLISVLFSFPVMFFGARNNFIAIAKLIFIKSTKQETKKWRQN